MCPTRLENEEQAGPGTVSGKQGKEFLEMMIFMGYQSH